MFREALGALAWASDLFATDEAYLKLHKARVKEAKRMAADSGFRCRIKEPSNFYEDNQQTWRHPRNRAI